MSFLNVSELRTWVSHTLTDDTSVVADTTIVDITTIIKNTDVSLVSIQAFFEDSGNLYLENANGKRHYLTDPTNEYPAKYQILSTYVLKKGDTVSLKYSKNSTMTDLKVMHSGGVF